MNHPTMKGYVSVNVQVEGVDLVARLGHEIGEGREVIRLKHKGNDATLFMTHELIETSEGSIFSICQDLYQGYCVFGYVHKDLTKKR